MFIQIDRYSHQYGRAITQMAADQEVNEKHADKSKAAPPQKTETPPQKSTITEKGEKIKKDLDKIMDEIDNVLEENAEEFIKSYVQRGGQ